MALPLMEEVVGVLPLGEGVVVEACLGHSSWVEGVQVILGQKHVMEGEEVVHFLFLVEEEGDLVSWKVALSQDHLMEAEVMAWIQFLTGVVEEA